MPDTVAPSDISSLNGSRLIAIAAIIGFLVCLIYYFTPHGTIAHQWGTLLVLVSTALMVFASVWIAFGAPAHWLLVLFDVLLLLDILGTGVCAYFLEATALLVLMVIALVGWIWHLAAPSSRISAN